MREHRPGRSSAARLPAALLAGALLVDVVLGTATAAPSKTPAFIAEIMPPVPCLTTPERACLLAAFEAVTGRYESREKAVDDASLKLFVAIDGGLEDPAVDALFLRYSPKSSPDRPKTLRSDNAARMARAKAAPADPAFNAPTPAELPAERKRIVATRDPQSRVSRTNKVVDALAAARRIPEAEALLAAVQKTLVGRDASLRERMAVIAARSFGAAGDWAAWSRSLASSDYPRKMANARTTSDAEDDPTEFAINEPLSQGVPVEDLLPWLARAKDRAFRDSLTTLVTNASFERGRIAAWTADRDGFRRYAVAATARGEVLHHPEYPSDTGDETLLGFCFDEARHRGDRVLALVFDLQRAIPPPSEDDRVARDRVRERVLNALANALVRAER